MASGYPNSERPWPPPPPPLPAGWVDHRVPIDKTASYPYPGAPPMGTPYNQSQNHGPIQHHGAPYQNQFPVGQAYDARMNRRPRPQDKPDKPKTKRAIPNAEPWLFVTTKKGNTFIHNPETKESLWTAPDDLKDAIESLEKLSISEERERERIRRRQSVLDRQRREQETATIYQEEEEEYEDPEGYYEPEDNEADETGARGIKRQVSVADQDEYGVGEDYYDDEEFEDDHDEKRLRLEQGGTVEFTEDDIAWQLGAMADDYGLEDEDLEGNEELAPEDGASIFKDLLNDYHISPYSTWESEMPKIVEDGRYTALPTTKLRKQVFGTWCQERIAILKAEKEKAVKRDPRVAYLDFLELNATPKLYWPEFKRKYKKELAMKDPKVTDKDREKYYRDYISRTKTSVETRENDLRKHLKTVKELKRSTDIINLPPSVSCDIRYAVVPRDTRERIVEDYIRALPEDADDGQSSSKEILEKQRRALEDREAAVRKEQYYNRRDIARGRETLKETEAEIRRAMNVGKEGLLGHLEPAKPMDEDQP